MYDDSLQHHGIRGQRWGVKNGPPYPLKPAVSRAVKITGAKPLHVRTKDGGHDSMNNREKLWLAAFNTAYGGLAAAALASPSTFLPPGSFFTPMGKAELAFGAATGLATGAITLGEEFVALHRNAKYAKERSGSEVDEKTGLKRIPESSTLSDEDNLKRVNPSYLDWNSDSKNNCMLCTTTYEMRRRGYDVTSQKDGYGYSEDAVKNWFPKAEVIKVPKTTKSGSSYSKKIESELKKQPEGSRGNLMIDLGFGWHSVFYEIQNGNVVIRDAQLAKTYKDPSEFLDRASAASFARLDNVAFDKKGIKEACYS